MEEDVVKETNGLLDELGTGEISLVGFVGLEFPVNALNEAMNDLEYMLDNGISAAGCDYGK